MYTAHVPPTPRERATPPQRAAALCYACDDTLILYN